MGSTAAPPTSTHGGDGGSFAHVSVLLEACLEQLAVTPGGRYADGTAGGAGHSRAMLERCAPDGRVLAVDRDPEALAKARAVLEPYGERAVVVQGNYDALPDILAAQDWEPVDGVLLDLGVSSWQLDSGDRGFSFRHAGPIDMRMGPDAELTALELIDSVDEGELADVLFQLGEERKSRRVARVIKRALAAGELTDTAALARVVAGAVGGSSSRVHPATRTFQALRIAVNDELGCLDRFLDRALELVRIGGRVAIIAFHSLEDRRVKQRFAELAGRRQTPPRAGGGPPPPLPSEPEEAPRARLLTRKAVKPSEDETRDNPRARSARLRAVERLR
jgi:16S rRNA (cytosine1402-N4)-methyltransferase